METGADTKTVGSGSRILVALKWLFCIWVVVLALYQFSENTADPDLWGHVLFGQDYLKTGTLAKTEPYSWTASGNQWINHEVLAEVALGWAHRAFGGMGILLLKVAIGLFVFFVALRLGSEKLTWPERAFAWVLGALALVEISFGFAPRPQIFTALALVIELWILRRIHVGSLWPVIALPVLFALWINTHGGALAGFGLLGLAAIATTWSVFSAKSPETGVSKKTVVTLWLALAASAGALLINPWGKELIRWLIGSVLWLRPEIEEWNPTPLNWDHAALFLLIAVTIFSWSMTRRRRSAWELLACAAFAVLALRSVRNTPLFAIIALAVVPPHFADACQRFRHLIAHREESFRQEKTLQMLLNFFWATSAAIFAATFLLHKDHPLTIEVPRAQYPVAAIDFIRKHEIHGNAFVFFDWGEMCIWELPDSAVSIDGRLDTCYPRQLIKEHWHVYNAEPHDKTVLDLDKSDFALLPSNLAGALALSKQPGWRPVYVDHTAAVLVRNSERFPLLAKETLPIGGPAEASTGRAPFPDKPSPRIARTK